MTMNDAGKSDLLRAVFDVLPSMVFVVDEDVRIQEYNTAASDLLMAERKTILKRRAGEILHCVHATDVPEGCGRAPSCTECIVRNSVTEAFRGNRVVRRRMRLELDRNGDRVVLYALITASPFSFRERPHALLVIEDISEIAELHRLIPICSVCRKVRDDKESWMQVESYFKNSWDVDFTHGFCPDCLQVEMDKITRIKAGQGASATKG
ncbi:PAS domain-containing protein [Geomobilimonas luticola]|uniref:PAS domain-containing protein n=1 Tax=Geomobilimonas luticola TaxID=1114878 RepID=A0ABS5SG25_9BACT|nr:PAS domain-containing protein [Geomobilimonas luticola]MBT0654318.1 PAS domain-containing protein [Geomobilimonas luticola]